MTNLVGVLRQNGKDGIVELDRKDENLGNRIHIPRKFLKGAPFRMKVVCEHKGTDSKGEPWGAITEVLGEEGNPDTAILSIMKFYNLPEKFPRKVIQEAKSFGSFISKEEIQAELNNGRRDLRQMQTITIDGEDAKDLDDAIDIEKLDDNKFKLYVHIADVSHYVKEDSELDKEAYKRGNSVYLVDRVIPMYPPQLSNGICSLNPDQDRFALTAEMIIDRRGKIFKGEIYPSLIRSKIRTSYKETQAIIDGTEPDNGNLNWFKDKVFLMRDLTDILQKMRDDRGALGFEFPETKIELDDEGHPIKIYPEPDLYTNHVIESFMISANELVGELASKHKIPVIYRVHELPDTEKLQSFMNLAKRFNIKMSISEEPQPIELAGALEQLKDEPFGPTLSTMLLRSLAKARYSEQNLGHFGLASENYSHFTAPIRRYSDTVTHRNLKKWLKEKKKASKKAFQLAHLIGDHVSKTERIAISAERDTVDQKAAEYYAERIGQIFDGKISGFSPASMFIQLDTTIEGALFFRQLDGYYEYDPEQFIAINRRTGNALKLGQKIKIQIASVDINRRFIDFALVEHETAERKVIKKPTKSLKNKNKKQPYEKHKKAQSIKKRNTSKTTKNVKSRKKTKKQKRGKRRK